jgi:hypothetical protein
MAIEPILVEISAGELIDKITILQIKAERLSDARQRANVGRELETLSAARDAGIAPDPEVAALTDSLRAVNEALWEIEDAIRDRERAGDFGERFVELARSVYRRNDERAALKRAINDRLGSRIVEEKSYQPY